MREPFLSIGTLWFNFWRPMRWKTGELVDAFDELGLKPSDSLPVWSAEVSIDRLKLLDIAISSLEAQWQPIEFSNISVKKGWVG